ncbi:MAG: hypothetical protein JST66_05470 [Bacteroidetes bacterium]|nr:hypothetical protein [Bacteroidota bacterium]
MTMTLPYRFTGLAIAALAAAPLLAQGGEEYYIQGIYTPTIANAQKIDLRPQPFDTILPDKRITYEMLNVKGEVPARVDSIEAAKLKVEIAQQKLYKGFVKAGFGLYTTPLAEIYYDQTRARRNGYGLHYKHMSSNGGIDDVGPSDYSFNAADAFYNAYLGHHEVSGRFLYDRRRVSYYGYNATDSLENLLLVAPEPPKDARKQVYNDIGFAVRLKSLYKDSTKLAHDVGLEVHNYANLSKSRELNLKLDARLGFEQGLETYGGDILIDNEAYRGELGEGLGDFRQSGTLIGISPFVSTTNDKYLVKVGAGIYIDAFGETTFHFYPQAYAQYNLFDVVMPYAGVDGQRVRNSFRSLTRENPWLTGAPLLANSSKAYDIYAGVRGSFSRDIGFDVRISKSRTKDRPLFVSTPYTFAGVGYGDRFLIAYDDVDQLDISGELRYSHDEHINVFGRIDVFSYDTDQQAEAWNLPSYRIGLGAVYDFQDKLLLKVEADFLGARKAAAPVATVDDLVEHVPVTVDLDGYVDLHLGLEYRYTKRLSVFLDASNLSASKYERWYRYPVQRGLILGGATYAF